MVDLKPIVDEFMKKLDINKFQRLYYAKIVLTAETYFTNLNKRIRTLFAKTLGDKIWCHFSKKDEPIQSVKPISEREMGVLQYLAGYVIRKLILTAKKKNNECHH